MTIPNVTPSGVIQRPGAGSIIADQLKGFIGTMQAIKAYNLKARDLANAEGQLDRQQKQDAANLLVDLWGRVPGLLDTEAGKGLARDAGLDPVQLTQAMQQSAREHQAKLQALIGQYPESERGAVSTILQFSDVLTDQGLTAEQKNKLLDKLMPEPDKPKAYQWSAALTLFRAGLTIEDSFRAFDLPVPKGLPPGLRYPKRANAKDDPDAPKVAKLTKVLTATRLLRDQADDDLNKFEEKQKQAIGGPAYKRAGLLTQEQQAEVAGRLYRYRVNKYPKYNDWVKNAQDAQGELNRIVQGTIMNQPVARDEEEADQDVDRILDGMIEKYLKEPDGKSP